MGRVVLPEHYFDWGSLYLPKSRKPVLGDGIVWILLNHGYVTVCDPEDFEDVKNRVWSVGFKHSNYGIIRLWASTKFQCMRLSLHRWILEPGDSDMVDHISLDALDNRRSNLRIADKFQNKQNGRLYRNNTSGYKGVHLQWKRYNAIIGVNGTQIYLGTFDTIEEAALVYNDAAKKHFGEFARLNEVPDSVERRGRQYFGTPSGYTGVYQRGDVYSSSIYVNGRLQHLGTFHSPELAAQAWNEAAIKYRGPNTRLNVIGAPKK